MAKVIINRENFKVDEIELEQGTLTVGRSDENDLHIDDLTVSGHHAQIVTVFGSTYVEDLGSTNGTFVNGKKVKTHTLHNGDVLTIGHYQLLFQGVTADNPLTASDQTRMINPSQVQALTQKASAQHKQASQSRAPARPASRPAVAAVAATPKPAPRRATPSSVAARGPALVSASHQVKMPDEQILPDIDDPESIIEKHTDNMERRMKPMRQADVSPSGSLKVIVLAALTAAATFVVMMLVFDL